MSHIAVKHLALADYLIRNPSSPPEADDAYDEEYIINSIIPHYKFITKYGCPGNRFNHSQHDTTNTTPRKKKQSERREQTAIDYLNATLKSRTNITKAKKTEMDVKSINNLEIAYPSAENRHLDARWRDIVKTGIYRQSGDRWKNITNRSSFEMKEKQLKNSYDKSLETLKIEYNNTRQRASNQKRDEASNG